MKKLLMSVAAGFIFLLLSCSGSRITSRWASENVQPKKYNKILVLGLMNHETSLREKVEKHIVGDLKDLGYNATSSFEEYGPKEFEPGNEKAILEKLHSSGVDAVLTIVLLDKVKERYYVPARVQYSPYSIYSNRFPGYYQTMYNRVFTQGYYTEETKYFWESNFYQADNRELLYSTQTSSFDAGSVEMLAHQYGRTIILDMVKHKVFVKPDESSLFEKR